MNKKSILIVGGTGVISFAVVNEALRQGFRVTCINRGKSRNQILDKSVEIIHSDYRDKAKIKQAINGKLFDAIIDVLCYKKEDIEYSVKLFKDHCNQYLFFSSAEAYNKPKYEHVIYNEDVDMENPFWDYSINKVQCERELVKLSSKYSFKYTIIRPAITYGNTRIPYGFMPSYGYHGTIIQRILHNKPLILFNGGKNIATILRVEDFAIGLVGLIGNEKAYNQDFHISGDEFVSWKQILDELYVLLGKTPNYIDIYSEFVGDEKPEFKQQIVGGRSYSQRLDNSKLKDAVPNFKTNIPLKKGLKMTVDYYQSHNYLNGIDWKFDADTDRIIGKWCKKKELSTKGMNISFIDYLGNATFADKFDYWLIHNKDNLFVNNLSKCFNITQRIFRKLYNVLLTK